MNIKTNSLFLLFIVLLFACKQERYKQGAILYETFCANCHMEAGQGLKGLYPPIANADYAKTHFKSIPCIIKNGLKGTIAVNGKVYNEEMVAIKELGEVEIANIMNFMNYTWQMEQEYFSPENVKTVLQNCK